MKIYSSLPQVAVHDWFMSDETHGPGVQVDFHYHDMDEWLEVVKGDITFFDLSGHEYRLGAKQALRIARGEVHHVEVGSEGVDYQMWLPVTPAAGFQNMLTPDEVACLKNNLESAEREDNRNNDAASFFDEFLSNQIVFSRADGSMVIGKKEFIDAGFKDRGRKSSGSVRVLRRTTDTLFLSAVVTVTEGSPLSFTNLKLFVREDGSLKCRMWINYPEQREEAPPVGSGRNSR